MPKSKMPIKIPWWFLGQALLAALIGVAVAQIFIGIVELILM